MLSVYNQMKCLKKLGYYTGKLDSIKGPLYQKAVKDLQNDYFTRAKDKDGLYGKNTDILLVNLYRIKLYTKNFKVEEFKCGCKGNCTGYPAKLSTNLLKNLQKVRDKYGPVTITSGERCEKYNNSLTGSSKTSYHLKGKAVDFKIDKCSTESGRKGVMRFLKTLPNYHYTYCNLGNSHPNMGKAIHYDVRE